jgi:tRNA threonylcarbamoyladenosine biosynthesis protein TsaB
LLCGDRVLAKRFEPMAKGQAERLMPLIEEVLAEDWDDLGMTEGTDILGFNADLLSEMYPPAYTADGPAWKVSVLPRSDLAATIGRIAATTLAAGGPIARPAPLYARPADAAPSREPAPTILSQ